MKPLIKKAVLEAKAGILCYGIQPNQTAKGVYREQNPCGDFKTGNVGLHLNLDGSTHVLATTTHAFDRDSPYSITLNGASVSLYKGQEEICAVQPVSMPDWYDYDTSSGKKSPEIFLHEGSNFIHLSYTGCDYARKNVHCRFCATGKKWNIASPQDIAESAINALTENPNYHICLGGGTRLPLSNNIEFFEKCASLIRKQNLDAPIWVEMTPPNDNDQIQRLIDAGVTSFGFNIEIWDNSLREFYCPGKSAISISRYLSALEYAQRVLGKNRVGSCLIVGLEPLSNTIEGIKELASRGIQPCLLPFKPWDSSELSHHPPCSPDELLRAASISAHAMAASGIFPPSNQGCLLCESCTIDHEMYTLTTQNSKGAI